MAHEREDLTRIKVQPLAVRRSKQAFEAIRVDPRSPPPPAGDLAPKIETVAERIRGARASGASVVLAFGAHLVKNGLGRVVEELMEAGWITHLATNGAGVIHDWEYAFLGRSEEDVRSHVAEGRFGCWDETGRCTLLAVLTGALAGLGYGESIGRFVLDGGCEIPRREDLWHAVADACETGNPDLLPAQTELLRCLERFELPEGFLRVEHRHPEYSLAAAACRLGVPLTVHPGIGYDIVYTHPMANGAAMGRAAGIDFAVFVRAVRQLRPRGVLLSAGSAVMAPQVFEKAVSIANNLRRQEGAGPLTPFIAVNDLAEIDWDWSRGEPPSEHPAYYIRFCKSFSRMGGEMVYLGGDNRTVLQNIHSLLA